MFVYHIRWESWVVIQEIVRQPWSQQQLKAVFPTEEMHEVCPVHFLSSGLFRVVWSPKEAQQLFWWGHCLSKLYLVKSLQNKNFKLEELTFLGIQKQYFCDWVIRYIMTSTSWFLDLSFWLLGKWPHILVAISKCVPHSRRQHCTLSGCVP